MAKPSNTSIPVVTNLDFVWRMIDLGRCPNALFTHVFSPPGVGKTAQMLASNRPGFLINGKQFGENNTSIPMVERIVLSAMEIKKAYNAVMKSLSPEEKADKDLVNLLITNEIENMKKKEVVMRPPVYRELDDFLLNYEKEYKKTGIPPILWVDEATQMPVEARDQFITAYIDGVHVRSLGLSYYPNVVMFSNGRIYGGANNFPLSPRQVARSVQLLLIPDGSDDIPVDVPGMNTTGSKKMRKEYHDKVEADFISGKNAISRAELPSNLAGNPRAQHTLLWYVDRVRATKMPSPVLFMENFVKGYIAADEINTAMEMVKSFFTDLPASVEEVRDIIKNGKKLPKLTSVNSQEWMAWARYRSDGTPQCLEDLAHFAALCGASEDTVDGIKQIRLK